MRVDFPILPLLWVHSADRQQVLPVGRLENATLGVDQGDALAGDAKAGAEVFGVEDTLGREGAAHVVESRLAKGLLGCLLKHSGSPVLIVAL